jgi:glycosyltransferase involved in cell wall biosynthesis
VRTIVAPPASRPLEPGSAPSFSIVVTAYQAATTVAEAITSALAQTVPPHEIVVVDDGSTDETPDVLRRFGDRIVVIRQENRGVSAATNAGVERARGEFVALLNADDVYEPERLAALSELAVRRPDLDILMTDLMLEVRGKVVGTFCDGTPFPDTDQRLAIFERCFLAEPAIRRSVLVAVGGFDETLRLGEDWECWIRLLNRGAVAGLVAEPLMRYRLGGPSLTSDRVAALRSRVEVLERAERLVLTDAERRELNRFLRRRRKRAALAEAERALREQHPDARGRALRLALTRGVSPLVRAAALGAFVAPGFAARRLAARGGVGEAH